MSYDIRFCINKSSSCSHTNHNSMFKPGKEETSETGCKKFLNTNRLNSKKITAGERSSHTGDHQTFNIRYTKMIKIKILSECPKSRRNGVCCPDHLMTHYFIIEHSNYLCGTSTDIQSNDNSHRPNAPPGSARYSKSRNYLICVCLSANHPKRFRIIIHVTCGRHLFINQTNTAGNSNKTVRSGINRLHV